MTDSTGKGPTIVDLPLRDEMQAALDTFTRALPQMLVHVELQAKLRRRSYLKLIEEGFNETQALDLCWRT